MPPRSRRLPDRIVEADIQVRTEAEVRSIDTRGGACEFAVIQHIFAKITSPDPLIESLSPTTKAADTLSYCYRVMLVKAPRLNILALGHQRNDKPQVRDFRVPTV